MEAVEAVEASLLFDLHLLLNIMRTNRHTCVKHFKKIFSKTVFDEELFAYYFPHSNPLLRESFSRTKTLSVDGDQTRGISNDKVSGRPVGHSATIRFFSITIEAFRMILY